MSGRTCIASARAAVLGMVLGTAVLSALSLLESWFDAGTTAFVIVYYLAPSVGAAMAARSAALKAGRRPGDALRAASIAGASIAFGEAGFVWLAWWAETSSPRPGDPWLAPTALLAPIVPAILLSAVGVILARRTAGTAEAPEPRPRAAVLIGLMLLGAALGLPLGFFGAMSIGMLYAESVGTCSIGAMGHAMLSAIIGPLIGAWMGRWAAIKWGAALFRSVT